MIDTHCHLTDTRLSDQLEAVLSRARALGVDRVITIGCEPEDDRNAIALCEKHDMLRCSIGIHPNYTHQVEIGAVDEVRRLQSHASVVALGEMGLDYHWDKSPRDRQRTFFEAQLQLARELKRPVVLHSREAIDDTLAILANFSDVRAVFHSFTGTPDEARRIAQRGYMIGFTGPVTYKRNDDLRAAARECPMDQLVVETDGPYLSPEPMRAQRINEPALVMHVAACIAREKGVSIETLDESTTRNAERFFGL